MTLVVMAAGLGSRYGGLKQLDPVGSQGEFIIDYSVFDAKNAGFDTVVFIIKEENHEAFEETIGKRIEGMEVRYAYQRLDDLPSGYSVPEGRVKPWGTGHAVYAARDLIKGPFAVINADDFYGRDAFIKLHEALSSAKEGEYFAVGYELKNTVTRSGRFSRGICDFDGEGRLVSVTERTKIAFTEDGSIAYFDDGDPVPLDPDALVSMNFWGFTEGFMDVIKDGFELFLKEKLVNELKSEYFLPFAVNCAMEKGANVNLLHTPAVWYGITYKEDRASVVEALQKMRDDGVYPGRLWNK